MQKKKKEQPLRDYLNKPMYETTIGDTLIMHASTIVMSLVISVSVQGWMMFLHRKR